jgi:hypothetical protein
VAICTRSRQGSADAVLAGLQGADAASRLALLRALARAGGPKALAAIQAAITDQDAKVGDEAVRALSAWPDLAAAEPLLALARTTKKMSRQVLALRGYVRLAGLQKDNGVKLKMLAEAEALAKRAPERKLILGALGGIPTAGSLKRISAHLDDPALVEEASAAAVRIAGPLAKSNRALVREALSKVVAKSKNRRTRRDAQRTLSRLRK